MNLSVSHNNINENDLNSFPNDNYIFYLSQNVKIDANLLKNIVFSLISALKNECKKNNLRIFGYNLLSLNGWQNERFEKLVLDIVNYTKALNNLRNFSINDAINQSINDYISIFHTLLTKEQPNILNYIPDEIKAIINRVYIEILPIVNKLVVDYLNREIRQIDNIQTNNPNNFLYNQQNMYQAPNYNNLQNPYNNQSQYTNPQNFAFSQMSGNSLFSNNDQTLISSNNLSSNFLNQIKDNKILSSLNSNGDYKDYRSVAQMHRDNIEEHYKPNVHFSNNEYTQPIVNNSRPNDVLYNEKENSNLVYYLYTSYKDKLSVTYNLEKPHFPLINYENDIPYFIYDLNTNDIKIGLYSGDENNMEYLKHELQNMNEIPKGYYPYVNTKVIDWSLLNPKDKIEEVLDENKENELNELLEENKHVYIGVPVIANTLKQSLNSLKYALLTKDLDVDMNATINVILSNEYISNKPISIEEQKTIKELLKCSNIEEYILKLIELTENDLIEVNLIKKINQISTNAFNEIIKKYFNISNIYIDDLIIDYKDFNEALSEFHPPEVVKSILNILNTKFLNKIILGGNQLLNDILQNAFIKSVDATIPSYINKDKNVDIENNINKSKNNIFLLGKKVFVTQLNLFSSDIKFLIKDNGSYINNVQYENLYNGVKKLLNKAEEKGVKNCYLITLDEFYYEVYSGAYNSDYLLIKKI